MSLGEKICALRKEKSFTQAELGNALGVTYQAVSKWERDESMPDFEMISKLAKLFGVPISHFENNGENVANDDALDAVVEDEQNDEVEQDAEIEQQQSSAQTANPALGVCTVCGKYVTADDVAQQSPKLVCKKCHAAQQAQAEQALAEKRRREKYLDDELSARFNKRAIIAAVVAGLIALTIFILQLVFMKKWRAEFEMSAMAYIVSAIAGFIMMFTWIFQLFFDGVVRSVTLAGLYVIKLPGIIFSADLNGLIFLVVMKVLFFIITVVVFIGAIIVTSLVAMLLSLVTFVPVVIKILRRNEDIL